MLSPKLHALNTVLQWDCELNECFCIKIQAEEVTEELEAFHKAVYQMQAQEEELIDCHHQVAEVCMILASLSLTCYNILQRNHLLGLTRVDHLNKNQK